MFLTHRLDAAIHLARMTDRGVLSVAIARRMARRIEMVAIVLDSVCDEELAIAAMLHDLAWMGDETFPDVVRRRFGDRVAECIQRFSPAGSLTLPAETWRVRREAMICALHADDSDAQMLVGAEALSHARVAALQLRTVGALALEAVLPDAPSMAWWLSRASSCLPAFPVTLHAELRSHATDLSNAIRRQQTERDLNATFGVPA